MSETTISITLNGRSLTAGLSDNPAARSLLDQLPLHQEFADYGGQEVQTRLPQPLTTEGMPHGESAPAGTIGYYAHPNGPWCCTTGTWDVSTASCGSAGSRVTWLR